MANNKNSKHVLFIIINLLLLLLWDYYIFKIISFFWAIAIIRETFFFSFLFPYKKYFVLHIDNRSSFCLEQI